MLLYALSNLQWQQLPSPAEQALSAAGGKAAVTSANETLFHEVLSCIALLCQKFPAEAATEFKRPIHWQTAVRPQSFATSEGFTVNLKSTKPSASSIAARSDNQPMLHVEQVGDGLYMAKASSFEYLQRLLQEAHGDKVKEIQEIFQSNRNILQNIIGVSVESSSPGKILMDAFETYIVDSMANSSANNGGSGQPASSAGSGAGPTRKADYNIRLCRLALVLNSFDLRVFQSTVNALQKTRILTMDKIEAEINMLQAFAGQDQRCPLISIDWESDYIFSNGYRAPPWRQVYGELAYIEVQPMDREKLIITAIKSGYYAIKGHTDNKATERLNYEKVSETYPTLVDLLKGQSKHFADHIDQQTYLYQPETRLGPTTIAQSIVADIKNVRDDEETASLDDVARGDAKDINLARKGDQGKEGGGGGGGGGGQLQGGVPPSQQPRGARKPGPKGAGAAGSGGKGHGVGHVPEPSSKWKALGFTQEEANGAKLKTPRAGGRAPSKKRCGGGGGGGTASEKGEKWQAKCAEQPGNKRWQRRDDQEDDFSESDSGDSSEEEVQEKRQESSELPAEYWQIQKLVKYLRVGNQTATIIAICSLRDFDLRNETNQLAIRDVGGLETLVNLLDTDDPKCKVGSLQILKEVCQNVQIRRAIAELDGMQPLVELLRDPNEELKCLAAETIAHCARNSTNRRMVRKYGGIRALVRLLKATAENNDERVAISGAMALSSCSKSAKNKEAIQAAGSIPLLAKLLQSSNQKLLIPVVGILQECASDEYYRIAIRASGMIKFLVENLKSNNEELQTNCASAIFKCAEDDETRTLVRKYSGPAHLVALLDNPMNKELLVAATGAVWKCAQNPENGAAFNSLNTIKKLVSLMENQPEEVLVNVVGALGACAQTPEGRQAIRESGGITPLVNLLTGTNQALLVNVTTAVGACALDGESMAIIDRLDGVRLLWSLLKSQSPQVQASAAWAICPCIEHAKDAGEMVRSFVGGLELIVSLLKSDSIDVLASVCAAIANIAKDEENLAVITDHGVVPMLAKLTTTKHDRLRKHLAEAIARCCHWGNNRVAFGTAGAVAPLVKYLKSPDIDVHRSTARALHQLSMDPDNCITMHENGVVQLLLGMVGSSDTVLQEAAAGTIGNIRRLALASEKATMD